MQDKLDCLLVGALGINPVKSGFRYLFYLWVQRFRKIINALTFDLFKGSEVFIDDAFDTLRNHGDIFLADSRVLVIKVLLQLSFR